MIVPKASPLPVPKAELSRATGLWLRRYAECHPRFEAMGVGNELKSFLAMCQARPAAC